MPRKARKTKLVKGGILFKDAASEPAVPPELHFPHDVIVGMSDKDLRTLRDRIRHEMRVGHPEYPFHYWKALCDLDVKLHLEAVNRQSYGTKIKRIKYGK